MSELTESSVMQESNGMMQVKKTDGGYAVSIRFTEKFVFLIGWIVLDSRGNRSFIHTKRMETMIQNQIDKIEQAELDIQIEATE